MAGDVALQENVRGLGVEPAGDVLRHAAQRVLPQLRRGVVHGDGVLVDDAEVALVARQQGRPVADGSKVVAQRERARGLGAGEDGLHGDSWKKRQVAQSMEKIKPGLPGAFPIDSQPLLVELICPFTQRPAPGDATYARP